jgi:hypothetical protein
MSQAEHATPTALRTAETETPRIAELTAPGVEKGDTPQTTTDAERLAWCLKYGHVKFLGVATDFEYSALTLELIDKGVEKERAARHATHHSREVSCSRCSKALPHGSESDYPPEVLCTACDEVLSRFGHEASMLALS